MSRFLLALCFTFLLAGCGQSGPLYLPGNPSQVTAVPPEAAGPDQGRNEDDEDRNGNQNGNANGDRSDDE